MEVDTPFQPIRIIDVKKELQVTEQSSEYLVPASLLRPEVDPMKEYANLPVDDSLKRLEKQVKSILNLDKDATLTQEYIDADADAVKQSH